MSNPIIYEQPLNERIRLFLRLEHLFSQAIHFQKGYSVWDSHASVFTLVEILTILDRTDIRSEIIKELDRHISTLSGLLDMPSVDIQKLDSTLDKLAGQSRKLQATSGKFGAEIRDNELLNSVRQRTTILGGTCGFDIPAYHHWLNQASVKKFERLSTWLTELSPLKEGIDLLLSMIRGSSMFETQQTENGYYQKILDTQSPCQLLRIAIHPECDAYPEVSGSKHRVNIRLLAFSELSRAKQIEHDQEFELACCFI
jgi:cell division protein ZapD